MANTSLKRAAICVFIMLAVVPMRAEAAITSVTVNDLQALRERCRLHVRRDHDSRIRGARRWQLGPLLGARGPDLSQVWSRQQGRRRRLAQLGLLSFLPCRRPSSGPFSSRCSRPGTTSSRRDTRTSRSSGTRRSPRSSGRQSPNDGQPHNHLVYGSIDRSADAWEILLDAARLLKDPSAYPGSDGPARVATVLSSGYSQGGGAQLELLAEGLDPARVYDGHLDPDDRAHVLEARRRRPALRLLGTCSPLPTSGNHAPVIVLASETDMLAFHPAVLGFGKSAFFTRNPANPNWRQYEMAGISHLPEPILSLGLPNQNTADARPIFRAAFDNLTRWTHGKHREKPPASRYFKGSVDATDAFIPTTDADGHFAGGVRLPHVESTVHGRVAGAPLGRYAPLNPAGLDPFHPFVFLGGTFTRFSDDELLSRYASRRQYVQARHARGQPSGRQGLHLQHRTGRRSSPRLNTSRCRCDRVRRRRQRLRRETDAASQSQQHHDEL